MTTLDRSRVDRVPLCRSQQNIYNGVLQDNDPALYLVGKSYQFHQLALSVFLTALEAAILKNPVQLCVLEAPLAGVDYPDLVPRLHFDDIVRVRPNDAQQEVCGDDELERTWSSDILAKPLIRYTVRTDKSDYVSGLLIQSHHILLDGGATGIIETDLAQFLKAGNVSETICVTSGLASLADAHRHEAAKAEKSLQRFADIVRRELTGEARHHGYDQGSNDAPGTAAKGVLHESVRISGKAYDAILTLAVVERVPINVLVAAAVVAVDASLRQSTQSLLIHAVDNRFGDPDLNVATCLTNSVAHTVRFSPFASVQDVVRALDEGYVKAVRRRWLREEQYRRMYLAINRTSHMEALTLNFIREPCAPGLIPFLSETPVVTDIGPVEGTMVTCVLDEDRHTLDLAIWRRADPPERKTSPRVAERIGAALESMPAMWHQPIAMTVDEWFGIGPDGARCQGEWVTQIEQPAPAWFRNPSGDIPRYFERRRYVHLWVAWLVKNGAAPGDVLVFTDDNTDKTIDLLIACHLAGCGYSVCDSLDEAPARAEIIADHDNGVLAHVIDVTAAQLTVGLEHELRAFFEARIREVAGDTALATKTAYIMPTSGSTGQPKLVRISHGSLAVFCNAIRHTYEWGPQDTILQCAPLTSDISVEEIFGAAMCGSELVRSNAMRTGDLGALAQDLVVKRPTVIDLPTAVWHLICDDGNTIEAIRHSRLRQIVIGGEALRPSTVDKWIDSVAPQGISLVSTYGPTETTIVVTHLPIVCDGSTVVDGARLRLGRPLVPDTVFIAFGEVVIVGDLVSTGYLGIDNGNFGTVTTPDGSRRRAFATADRVTFDDEGFPVFSGRKDAIAKIAGKRVDTAEVSRFISDDPAVSDVAVKLHNGGLAVWFETQRTRQGAEDTATTARIRLYLTSSRVPSFFVVGVPNIPRKPNGKLDVDNLPAMPQLTDARRDAGGVGESAAGLAEMWSRHLGRTIREDSSLLDEGIGSLDLIKILPDTRRYLGRQLSLLDLISADIATNLIGNTPPASVWMDVGTAGEIERDLDSLARQGSAKMVRFKRPPNGGDRQTIVVLGASGILGTGFAQAILDLRRSGIGCPEVVLAARSKLPECDPWTTLQSIDGVRVEQISSEFGPEDVDALIRDTGARTLVNCIGNTNVLMPYRGLRLANVELVSTIAKICANRGTRLVHLSTFVVNADVTVPRVTDPRDALYPYAASKSIAELIVARSPHALDFTIVRLPRVLGEADRMHDSADILVSIVDACIALSAYPSVALTEEVTTGRAAAKGILSLLPELVGSAELGRGITVVRGESVSYATFLSEHAREQLDIDEWKYRLDQSDWAKRNPRRWSVIDAWVTLTMRFGTRSSAEGLTDYPTIALGVESVVELIATPQSVQRLLAHGCS